MEQERELGWQDTIVKDAEEYPLWEDGDYHFIVESFERARTQGTGKLPPCNMAKLTIKVINLDTNDSIKLTHQLILHSKMEWKLSEFFSAIGQKKKGEPLQMNWNLVPGSNGTCHLCINKYIDKNGVEKTNNKIDKFYPVEEKTYTYGDF